MDNPKVSVIIPNYNHARYLDQRIQSVLNQTYQDFEVIILDDCSTDNSLDVINKYKDNQHISQIIVNERNSGSTFKQWDKGIHLAKGELIWIAESDDYCELSLLEELVKSFQNRNGLVLSFCGLEYVDSTNQVIGHYPFNMNGMKYMPGKDFIRQYQVYGNHIRNASAVLFNRSVALSVNPLYKSFRAAGDFLFWCMMIENGEIAFVPNKLNYCRTDGLNVTNKSFKNGRSFEEDYRVHKYLCSKGYLKSIWLRLSVKNNYILWIKQNDFEIEDKRNELLKLWDPIKFYRSRLFPRLFRGINMIHWKKKQIIRKIRDFA